MKSATNSFKSIFFTLLASIFAIATLSSCAKSSMGTKGAERGSRVVTVRKQEPTAPKTDPAQQAGSTNRANSPLPTTPKKGVTQKRKPKSPSQSEQDGVHLIYIKNYGKLNDPMVQDMSEALGRLWNEGLHLIHDSKPHVFFANDKKKLFREKFNAVAEACMAPPDKFTCLAFVNPNSMNSKNSQNERTKIYFLKTTLNSNGDPQLEAYLLSLCDLEKNDLDEDARFILSRIHTGVTVFISSDLPDKN